MLYIKKKQILKNTKVLVKKLDYYVNDDDFNEVVYDYKGNPMYSTMISKLCNYNHRSEFIIKVLIKELELNPQQQIMILAHNKCLITYLYKAIEHKKYCYSWILYWRYERRRS